MNYLVDIFKREKYFLIGLFLAAFFIRALVFHFYLSKEQNYWQVDSGTYHKVAENIAQGKGISVDGRSNFYRLPGYPIFLSVYYKIFGSDKKNVLWVQLFFACFIPFLIFLLSLILFPQNFLLAKIASAYSAFHLGLVLYAGFFMTESLFILFFLLFCLFFFSSFHWFFCNQKLLDKYNNVFLNFVPDFLTEDPFNSLSQKVEEAEEKEAEWVNIKRLFFAGIFLGCASLIRPVGHYLIVLSIAIIFFADDILKIKFKNSVSLFVGWFAVVFFWLLRNFLLTGYLFFHTLPGGHFLYFSAARVVTHTHNCSYQQAKQVLSQEVDGLFKQQEDLLQRPLSEIEKCKISEKLAIKYFVQHPFITLKNWLTDMMRASFSLYSAELLYLDSGRAEFDYFSKDRTIFSMFKRYLFPNTQNKFLIVLIWLEILSYLFILIGFLLLITKTLLNFNRIKTCSVLKVLPFMALFIIISLSGGFNRMRLPIEPFLIVLSFSFWLDFFKNKLEKF